MKILQNKIGVVKKLLNPGTWIPSPISRRGLIYSKHVVVSDEVRNTDRPLVALESTIITHGLPYPDNVKMALDVENMIKAEGAVPATIAFFNGKFRVGLSKEEIEMIAAQHKQAIKISRRDIPYILASDNVNSIVGGTTVSATSIVAHAARIPIFCTGGIGGVHRDYNDTMDVSADLQELARTPVAVISSGVKSILDIEKTLEYLETMGVCVAVLNKNGSKTFPSFFTSRSRFEAPYNARNEAEAARLIHANFTNGLTPNTGILIAVPIPEEHSADDAQIDRAINEALAEAHKLNIKGKKVTPFLLDKLNKLTKGKSLASNLALIKNNARTSARIAVELHKLTSNDAKLAKQETRASSESKSEKSVTVIGGANLDLTFKILCDKTLHMSGVTQPGQFNYNLGGVGRNMSEALIKLGISNTKLITAVANDMMGNYVVEESARLGLDTSHIRVLDRSQVSTGSYCAIFEPSGELKLAIGDMKAHDSVTPELIDKNVQVIKESEMCVLDACMSTETIERICYLCNQHSVPVWYNPTDIRKCNKIISSLAKVTYISPNMTELFELFRGVEPGHQLVDKYKNADIGQIDFEDLKTMIKHLLNYVPFIFLSRGGKDLILASLYELDLNGRNQLPLRSTRNQLCNRKVSPHIYMFPVIEFEHGEEKINVSGAGDSASSAFIAGIVKDYPLNTLIYYGLKSAKLSILSSHTISPTIANIDKNELEKIVEQKKSKIKTLVL